MSSFKIILLTRLASAEQVRCNRSAMQATKRSLANECVPKLELGNEVH